MHHHNNKQGNLVFEPGTVRGQTHEIAIAEFNWYFSKLDLMNSQLCFKYSRIKLGEVVGLSQMMQK